MTTDTNLNWLEMQMEKVGLHSQLREVLRRVYFLKDIRYAHVILIAWTEKESANE